LPSSFIFYLFILNEKKNHLVVKKDQGREKSGKERKREKKRGMGGNGPETWGYTHHFAFMVIRGGGHVAVCMGVIRIQMDERCGFFQKCSGFLETPKALRRRFSQGMSASPTVGRRPGDSRYAKFHDVNQKKFYAGRRFMFHGNVRVIRLNISNEWFIR
jgi:hypothetical protein